MKTLKGASAHFVNTELRPPGPHFAWQRGYGSLTVGERQRADAVDYVLRQKERHQQQTTNVWLERCGVDEEEGRLNEEEEMPPSLSILCETSTSYEFAVDLPW